MKRVKTEDQPLLDPIDIYLRDIEELPILPRKDIVKLFKEIELYTIPARKLACLLRFTFRKPKPYTQDIENQIVEYISQIRKNYARAMELIPKVVSSNIRLAINRAKHYQNKGLDLLDLIGVANYALFVAAMRFNYRKGAFSTYARITIHEKIIRAIANQSKIVRTPDYKFFKTGGIHCISLDSVFEDGSAFLVDPNKDKKLEFDVREMLLDNAKHWLDRRDYLVIKKRYGLDGEPRSLTLKEVGKEFGLTRERVRQIESRCIKKLRSILEKPLENYLASA